jgi:short-subunit dehydrogenase
MSEIESRTAVVTGASAGIGALYARGLARQGHAVALVARRVERLHRLAEELRAEHGTAVECLAADLATDEGTAAVAERVARDDVAVVVNNAGIGGYGPLVEADPELLQRVVQLNVVAPTLIARAALPGMLSRGSGGLINVGSLLAFSAGARAPHLPQRATYAASKAYVVAFTRALAGEVAGSGVTVQVCCPGRTATEFHLSDGLSPVSGAFPADPVRDPRDMDPTDVVTASLRALRTGEVVCVPGLDDRSSLTRLAEAEDEVRAASRPVLAPRYR